MDTQNGLECGGEELLEKLIVRRWAPEVLNDPRMLDEVLQEVWFLPDDVRDSAYGCLHSHFSPESPEARQVEQAERNRGAYGAFLEHGYST